MALTKVTTGGIKDGTITNEDISASANIPATKLEAAARHNVGDGGLSQKNFTTTLASKLSGIESGATSDQTKSDIEALGIDASTLTGSLPSISGANLTGLAASSLSVGFTVAAGKTVVAATVANLFNGEVGTNPVANTLGTEQSYSAETFNYITGDGNTIVKAYSNGSSHHCVKTIRTSDMTVVSDVAAYTGYTSAGTSLGQLSDNRFIVYGSYRNTAGKSLHSNNYWNYPSYGYATMFEVSATGVITTGNTYTTSNWSGSAGNSISFNVKYLKGIDKGGFHIYRVNQTYHASTSWVYNYSYDTYTVPHSGGLNLSSVWSGQNSDFRVFSGAIFNSAATKVIQPSTGTTWDIMSWNGSSVSSKTSIPNNRTNLSTARFIKPNPSQDKLLCFYINTNLELCVETLDWTSSSIDVVANSKWVVEADASGVSLGDIKGSVGGIGITYENGSKGRFKSLSLDSNMVVTGSSSLMTITPSNVVPDLAYKGNDKFQAWNNNVDTYTNEITVNAYSTSPLTPLGVITENGTGGDTVSVTTTGVVGGFTGLTVDAKYYYNTAVFDGTVTLVNTGTYVGRAVSTTAILLTDLTEQ